MKPHILLLSASLWIAYAEAPLMAAPRVALVIGNSNYDNLSGKNLTSPVNDAQDIARELSKLGYSIVTGRPVTNASRDGMVNAIARFRQEAAGAEAAVFYFSGHGVQADEDNYLLPSDTPKLTGITSLRERAVVLRGSVMQGLEEVNARHKVIVLDCCRDNPFKAQLEDALGKIGKSIQTKTVSGIDGYGPGFYLAFATSPGDAALDGNGARNSPFTAAMLTALQRSANKDLDLFFRDVKKLLPKEQVSWTNHSIADSFSLAPASAFPEAANEIVTTTSQIISSTIDQPATDLPPTPSMRLVAPALPPRGYFSLHELFAGTSYEKYNGFTKERILRDVQGQLRPAGLYRGEVDGDPGPGTQQGIIAWQQNHHLPVTGLLDSPTLDSMNLSGIAEVIQPPRPHFPPSPSRPTFQPQGVGSPGLFGGGNSLQDISHVTSIISNISGALRRR